MWSTTILFYFYFFRFSVMCVVAIPLYQFLPVMPLELVLNYNHSLSTVWLLFENDLLNTDTNLKGPFGHCTCDMSHGVLKLLLVKIWTYYLHDCVDSYKVKDFQSWRILSSFFIWKNTTEQMCCKQVLTLIGKSTPYWQIPCYWTMIIFDCDINSL